MKAIKEFKLKYGKNVKFDVIDYTSDAGALEVGHHKYFGLQCLDREYDVETLNELAKNLSEADFKRVGGLQSRHNWNKVTSALIIVIQKINSATFEFVDFGSPSSKVMEGLTARYLNEAKKTQKVSGLKTRLKDIQYYARTLILEDAQEHGLVEPTETEVKPVNVKPVASKPATVEITETVAETVEAPEWKPNASSNNTGLGLDSLILNEVLKNIEKPEVGEFINKTVVRKLKEWGAVPHKVDITVHPANGEKPIHVGTAHEMFPKVLTAVQCRINVALVGPAGSGKTSCAHQVAEALSLPYYSKSVSAQTPTYEFFGFYNAEGKYITTDFRRAFEFGGVYLLDEFDAGNPNVLASLNQATSNGTCSFPDGLVKKHKDFVVICAGNTYGKGATMDYVGRNKLDDATLDRFVFMPFDYDERFEMQLSTNHEWCKKIQRIRAKVFEKRIRTIVSPRATFMGEKLLEAGMDEKTVLEMVVFKGMDLDSRRLLEGETGL